MIRRYKSNPMVLYAEPDYVVKTTATPNDPGWGQQWDIAKIAAPAAWDTQTNASDVVVAVIDTGIDFTHPDLQGNLWSDPINGANHGYTCMNGICSAGGLDDFGHGTHVAGTIGAVGNNGIGIAGLNWSVQLLSCKFLDSTGSGQISDAVLCFDQVLALRQQGINVRVTSNSWGGSGYSQALKDAMLAVESAGVVNVCAAGNNAVDADVLPMYPAAFDNRALISVLASDSNDAGAYFTNYGLASVDIAAPGLNTLSTVPSGNCSLCDPSGFKFLSGTSMATPHVSGVLAALFHRNPALTAAEARDIVLDPASYDAVTDPLAQSSTTGGRLNFAKALANPLLANPTLNNFPSLTMPPNVFTGEGTLVNLTPLMSDPDNDPLRTAWSKSQASAWLLGWMLNSAFPNPSGSSVSFTAPSLARTAVAQYELSVADGRGGSAQASTYVTVSPMANLGPPPSGSLSVSSMNPAASSTITVNFPVVAAAAGPTGWDLWMSTSHFAMGRCCFTGPSASVTLNGAGVYRFNAQAIDSQLNLSARSSLVLLVGGASGNAPVAAANLDTLSGPAPLTVHIDMSASYVINGSIQSYSMNCGGGLFGPGAQASSGSCTFTTPGTYWIILQVQDNNGNLDTTEAYVVVTPQAGTNGDGTPPSVSISSPASGSVVSGNVGITASASDAQGISKVDFYADQGVFLGTSSAPPYNITWNTGSLTAGGHSLYAVATDTGGNSATSASVEVTVDAPPVVSITSPASNTAVSGNVAVSASASSAIAIQKVDFYLDAGILLGTATVSPYTVAWNSASAIPGGHTLYAIATDSAGITATSATIAVTVAAPPAVSITSPVANAIVSGTVSVAAVASSSIGIKKVDFYLDAGVSLGTGTTSPYTVPWSSGSVVPGGHSLYAIATDAAGTTAASAAIPVNVAAPPVVSITSPAASATVSGNVSVSASASSAIGIKNVAFYLDGGLLLGTATASPYTVTWNSGSVPPGPHSLYASATDTAGTPATSAPITVTVAGPPQVSISIQPGGATVPRKTAVTITASVASGGFPISRVDFLVNSTVACSDAASPYACIWQVPPAGGKTYQLTAKAYDTNGQSATSNTITVTSK